MSEENKRLFARFIEEAMNKGNLAAVDEMVAADAIEHDPAFPGQAPGAEGMKQIVTMFRGAFPDLHVHVEDLIAEGDKVVGRLVSHGTHKGELMGIAATGKEISISEMHIVRISGGKMVEHWGIADNMTMMQQLGVAPAQG